MEAIIKGETIVFIAERESKGGRIGERESERDSKEGE